ncbi:MAG: signal recognition particle-docking protein FtsY [Candidatus Nanohalarchaeota archaeon]|nr:MAG: signal recognition particle-docking protein FtsY [Candidatus Nanohaloarchaeota archaeon]
MMFGLFKKKIKDAVDKLSGKIEEETKPVNESEAVEDVFQEENEEEHTPKDVELGRESSCDELRSEEGKRDRGVETLKEEEKREEVKKEGFLSKFTKPIMSKTLSPEFLDDVLWDLELVLLENNVAQDVSQKIVDDIKEKLADQSVRKSQAEKIIKDVMKSTILEILDQKKVDIDSAIDSARSEGRALLILFLGFNGSGKTTTMAKTGKYLLDKGHTCVFAAADSFRAAAIEQLEFHGNKLSIKVIKQKYGTDPAAIIFDAVKHANSRGINVVLADTAGRVHTDRNLVEELKKIVRVNKPDLKFLVIESIAGNDVVEQAKVFDEVGLDGVVLTKVDVDDKGGSALSLCYTLRKPICFICTGQEYSDFEEFDARKMVDGIF